MAKGTNQVMDDIYQTERELWQYKGIVCKGEVTSILAGSIPMADGTRIDLPENLSAYKFETTFSVPGKGKMATIAPVPTDAPYIPASLVVEAMEDTFASQS